MLSKAASNSSSSLIQATSRQTRFNIQDDTNSKEIDLHTVNLSIGKLDILSDAHLKLANNVHYVLVGRNGVGKSTLLRAISDKAIPGISKNLRILLLQQNYYDGEHSKAEESLSVLQYVVQSDRVLTETIRKSTALRQVLETNDQSAIVKTVRQLKHEERMAELEEAIKMATLRSGARGLKARKELKALEEEVEVEKAKLADGDDSFGNEVEEAVTMLSELDSALENMSASTRELRAETLLLGLGFTKTSINQHIASLSGGWRMRTMLAAILFQPCEILLLDEPTNFLDMASLLWLENHLKDSAESNSKTILLVSHDRTFVDAVAQEVLVLRDKKLERFPGNLTAYDQVREENRVRLTKMKEAQEKQKAHMEQSIIGNIRAAKVTGDDKKLKQAVSRQKKLDERMGYQVGIRGGRFKLNRDLPGYYTTMRAEIEVPDDDISARLALPVLPPSELQFPGPLVSCDKLTAGYLKKDNPSVMLAVLKDICFTMHLRDRVALVGLNGAGKSTLVSIINQTPDSSDAMLTKGTVQRHPRARIGYFSQGEVDNLPLNLSALQYVSRKEPEADEPLNNAEEQVFRKQLASLGLSGKTVTDLPISHLSGGQRVRVALSKILYPLSPHLLILDEVTTHLDADSITYLAEGLKRYEGAVLIVSHDRWFVKRVVEDENEDDEDESAAAEGGAKGRLMAIRKVYLVGKGQIEELAGGIREFEKRVRKYLKNK